MPKEPKGQKSPSDVIGNAIRVAKIDSTLARPF